MLQSGLREQFQDVIRLDEVPVEAFRIILRLEIVF